MRRHYTSLLLGLGVTAAATAALAGTADLVELVLPAAPTPAPAAVQFASADPAAAPLSVIDDASLPAPQSPAMRAPMKANTAIKDLSGFYVGTYKTLTSGSYDGGSTMKIDADAEGDSITVAYFWNRQPVRAFHDKTTGEVRIPSQYIMVDQNLGALKIATCTSTGAPDYAAEITGTVTADGGIDFSSKWWGIYVTTGTNKDKFVGAYYSASLVKPNGTMAFTDSKGQKNSYYVCIEQSSPNTLKVTNIMNYGLEIEIDLNRNRTATINSQVGIQNANGPWFLITCKEFNEAGNLTKYSGLITTPVAAADNNTTLTWTDWSVLSTTVSSYMGHLTDARLTADTPFSYPELKSSEFEGEGTEASPYLIKCLDDFILLADKVNADDQYLAETGADHYTESYKGKYFALANDIDMQGYKFDVIGSTSTQRFDGTFDGRGHKITGLAVKADGKSMNALFGFCGTDGVLKNVVIEKPVIDTYSGAAGALAGYCYGVIDNVTVTEPAITGVNGGTGAVAGIVDGKITNCRLVGGTVHAVGYVGGIAGQVKGEIANCSADGAQVSISGAGYPVGGVVGNLLNAKADLLYFNGVVTYAQLESDGAQSLGGVAGLLQNSTLNNSFASGIVRGYGNDSELGGVVGRLANSVMEDCYSSGWVHCYTRRGGGIVGHVVGLSNGTMDPAVRNCYTSATVEIETYQYDRNRFSEVIGLVEPNVEIELTNVYGDRQVTNFYSKLYGSSTAELTAAAGPKGFSADKWTFTEGAYPRVKGLADTEAAKFSASAINMAPVDNFRKLSANTPLTALGNTKFYLAKGNRLYTEGYYSKVVGNNTLEIGEEFGADTLYVVNGDVQTFHVINIAPIPFEGDGTAEAPFLIKTKADMLALSEATTVKCQTFPGMYFELANDIDMELDKTFDGICADNSVSSASVKFQGVLDGKGHTIDRIALSDRVFWTTAPTDTKVGTLNTSKCRSYAGLVGRLGEDGIIRNINIGPNSKFEFYGTSGAFVGSQDGLVENCRNYADVVGYSCWIGGISGMVNKGGRIHNCYNAGNITGGYANTAGIAGTCNGEVVGCANTGNIRIDDICTNYNTQRQRAGGIIGGGSGAMVKDCVNYGTVYAKLNNVGGIAGSLEGTSTAGSHPNDVLQNCVNLGNVYCGNKATLGAVLGLKGAKTVANVYYDAQMIGLKAGANSDVDNISGISTAALTSGTPLEGLDAEVWDFKAGMYPAIKAFADEPKVAAARKVLASVAEGETVAELFTDVTLGDGATWSLVDGSSFKVEGGKLIVPKGVEAVVGDTLVAVNAASVRRPIYVCALPAMPLTGEGTEASPFIIASVSDWDALAAYISNTGKNLKDQYVKLAADLDFTGVATPKRMGADGVTAFDGTFDGAGHTIKGVTLKSSANYVCALFGTVDADATLKNFVFEGSASATHTFCAPLVDKLYGTIENVVSKAEITTNKASVGGVVAYAYTGASFKNVEMAGKVTSSMATIGGFAATTGAGVSFKDCKFTGKISQTASYTKATDATVGGFVATTGAASFDGCVSDGEITIASNTFAKNVAGFLANALGAKDNGLYTFTNCVNRTAISAGGKVAGFISGTATTAANAQYVFTDCVNEGDISAESTTAMSSSYTSGLISCYTPGSSFTRCHNEGTIVANKNVYAAGLVAYYTGTPGSTATPATVEFTDCYNSGAIIADGNQGGGICGYIFGAVTLTRCYNAADIEAVRMAGGITSGFGGTGPKLIDCYNTGNVTTREDRAGGLIAWGSPTGALVEGCWNAGNVSSLSEVQSDKTSAKPSFEIAGLAGQSGAEFRNCYNVGSVKGLARVAGLVASPVKNRTKITNCYNAGKIDAPADSCGSILGIDIANGHNLWNTDNAVEKAYYLDINKSDSDSQFGTAVSRRELAALDLGEGFTSIDNYTHPVVTAHADNQVALFHAAEVVLAETDTPEKVTTTFNVGGGSAVTWTSDCADLAINGSEARFTKEFTGPIKLTATAGELTKTYELVADKAMSSGIRDILGDGADVVSRRYYTPQGIEVNEPSEADRQLYIIVETLSDGSTRTVKAVND